MDFHGFRISRHTSNTMWRKGHLPLHLVLHLSVLGFIFFPCVSLMQKLPSARGETAAIGANKLLLLRGGGPLNPNHRMEADVDFADIMDELKPGARQSAIDELRRYRAPKEVWKSEDEWLAEDDPECAPLSVSLSPLSSLLSPLSSQSPFPSI